MKQIAQQYWKYWYLYEVRFLQSFSLLSVIALGLGCLSPAEAAIIYELNLPANGSVAAIRIQLTFDSFTSAPTSISGLGSASPEMTLVEVDTRTVLPQLALFFGSSSTVTSIGVSLPSDSPQEYLLYPVNINNLFNFERGLTQTGVFTASSTVGSDFQINTITPTATLTVTDTEAVPEPATLAVVGLSLCALAYWRKSRHA